MMAKAAADDVKRLADALEAMNARQTRQVKRSRISDFGRGFVSLGNLAVAGLVFVQFDPNSDPKLSIYIFGFIVFGILYGIGWFLLEGGEG